MTMKRSLVFYSFPARGKVRSGSGCRQKGSEESEDAMPRGDFTRHDEAKGPEESSRGFCWEGRHLRKKGWRGPAAGAGSPLPVSAGTKQSLCLVSWSRGDVASRSAFLGDGFAALPCPCPCKGRWHLQHAWVSPGRGRSSESALPFLKASNTVSCSLFYLGDELKIKIINANS